MRRTKKGEEEKGKGETKGERKGKEKKRRIRRRSEGGRRIRQWSSVRVVVLLHTRHDSRGPTTTSIRIRDT